MAFTETYVDHCTGVMIARFLSRAVGASETQLSGMPTGKLVVSFTEGHWEKRAEGHFILSYSVFLMQNPSLSNG